MIGDILFGVCCGLAGVAASRLMFWLLARCRVLPRDEPAAAPLADISGGFHVWRRGQWEKVCIVSVVGPIMQVCRVGDDELDDFARPPDNFQKLVWPVTIHEVAPHEIPAVEALRQSLPGAGEELEWEDGTPYAQG